MLREQDIPTSDGKHEGVLPSIIKVIKEVSPSGRRELREQEEQKNGEEASARQRLERMKQQEELVRIFIDEITQAVAANDGYNTMPDGKPSSAITNMHVSSGEYGAGHQIVVSIDDSGGTRDIAVVQVVINANNSDPSQAIHIHEGAHGEDVYFDLASKDDALKRVTDHVKKFRVFGS